jgi:S1-C subfamily serine protease
MENSFDYAILDVPQLFDGSEHQFLVELPGTRRIGDQIAILGFPFEHQNLTVHTGVISSFYQSNLAQVVQLDASINSGNSGGPVIDPRNGAVFGIVTRKATGLTATFDHLRRALDQNIQLAQHAVGMMQMGSFDPAQGFIAGQSQIIATLAEIERQANVGIGYAISTEHIMADVQLPSV